MKKIMSLEDLYTYLDSQDSHIKSSDTSATAAALYDGGWRWDNPELLDLLAEPDEYSGEYLTPDAARDIIHWLERYETAARR